MENMTPFKNWSMYPGSKEERVDWYNGGTLVIFIFLAIFFYYASWQLVQSHPLPPNQSSTANSLGLTPEIFNWVWAIIIAFYAIGAYFTFINMPEQHRLVVYLILLVSLLLIYAWTYFMAVLQDTNWAIATHIGLLIVNIAFLILAWKHSRLASFVLFWPILWLIFAFFLY